MNSELLRLATQITKANIGDSEDKVFIKRNEDESFTYLIKGRTNGNSLDKLKNKKSDEINDFKQGTSQSMNLK